MTESPNLLDQLADWHEDAFSWAVACCRGDAEAGAEALQEAYVKVATERARFGGKSSLKTWWLSVVRFTALERGRGQERGRRLAEAWREWWTASGAETPEPEASAVPCDPERLREALARLPPRQAEVLHLVFQQACSLSEAAAVMGVSLGSARQHYDRAKRRLRALLAAETIACAHES